MGGHFRPHAYQAFKFRPKSRHFADISITDHAIWRHFGSNHAAALPASSDTMPTLCRIPLPRDVTTRMICTPVSSRGVLGVTSPADPLGEHCAVLPDWAAVCTVEAEWLRMVEERSGSNTS